MAISHNEGDVGQLAAAEGHLEILCQLVTVTVLLMDTVQHWRWGAAVAGERERERGREEGREAQRRVKAG